MSPSLAVRIGAILAAIALTGWTADGQWTHRYPQVRGIGNAVYLDGYELPIVNAGPTDPAPSPDGTSLAIAARGWLWLLDVTTGTAKRLTAGPAMDSRPAWSPDGRYIAFLRDDGRDIDIWEIDIATGSERVLVSTGSLDLDPVYTADGRSIVYSSAEAGDLDLWRLDRMSGQRVRITQDQGLELRPLPLPADEGIVYVSKVNQRDAIVLLNPATGARRVLTEDGLMTQTRPSLSPDGRTVVAPLPAPDGVWDLWLMDLAGGPVIHLTRGSGLPLMPAWSADGSTVYFAEADAEQRFRLYSVPRAGGAVTDVSPATWDWGGPTAQLRVTTHVGSDPRPVASRVMVVDAHGHPALPDGGQARFDPQNGVVYVYSSGTMTVEVPAGEVTVLAARGFSTVAGRRSTTVDAGQTASVAVSLEPLWQPDAEGWFSGDHHFHLNYGGQFALVPEDLLPIMYGEDLDVATPLLANLHTRFNDRQFWTWRRLASGRPLIAFGQEIRPHFLGHMGIIGVESLYWPWYWGPRYEVYGRDDRPNQSALEHARREGGVNYFVHPVGAANPFPPDGPPRNIPLALVPEAVLGAVDALEIACIWSDELHTADVWHRFLNLGLPVAPSGGTDAFPNFYRGHAVGITRVYVRPEGPLNLRSYLDALRQGRSFVTNGPLPNFRIAGRLPGDVIAAAAGEALPWSLAVDSAVPYDRVELIVNGKVIWTGDGLSEPGSKTYSGTVGAPPGGWIAMRVVGSAGQVAWPAMDSYPFAHTAPVWLNAVGTTDPEAARQAAFDLLRWMDVAERRLAEGYGDAPIPMLKERFASARRKLEEWKEVPPNVTARP